MWIGICPPSKAAGTFLRAPVPLVPRPALLPLEPSPRPTRVFGVLAPGAGRRWWTLIAITRPPQHSRGGSRRRSCPNLGTVLLPPHMFDPLRPERPRGAPLVLLPADPGPDLGALQACHQCTAASARAASMAAGATSSTGRPRRAATFSGDSRPFSAATVACTMLIGLDDPRLLLSTSWMPAHSSTARTGPPAMTPVPAEAGWRSTTPAAASPVIGCGSWRRSAAP